MIHHLPLHSSFTLVPSGRRYRQMSFKTSRIGKSLFLSAISSQSPQQTFIIMSLNSSQQLVMSSPIAVLLVKADFPLGKTKDESESEPSVIHRSTAIMRGFK
ncbi:hypothetical protein ILYODFUR_033665 [Ilyodon furcidens]|uniref:Uncharacterized protein n=1 Tax=Ilyodon furcidens TaxID=33524 RepID=A0ABV0VKR9_9TELE